MTELEDLREHFVSVLPNVVGERRELMANHIRVISSAIEEIDGKTKALEIIKAIAAHPPHDDAILEYANKGLEDFADVQPLFKQQGPSACYDGEHQFVWVDTSFDHGYGIESCGYYSCEECGEVDMEMDAPGSDPQPDDFRDEVL